MADNLTVVIKYWNCGYGLNWSSYILGLISNPKLKVTSEEISPNRRSDLWGAAVGVDLIVCVLTPGLLEHIHRNCCVIRDRPICIGVLLGEGLEASQLPDSLTNKWRILDGTAARAVSESNLDVKLLQIVNTSLSQIKGSGDITHDPQPMPNHSLESMKSKRFFRSTPNLLNSDEPTEYEPISPHNTSADTTSAGVVVKKQSFGRRLFGKHRERKGGDIKEKKPEESSSSQKKTNKITGLFPPKHCYTVGDEIGIMFNSGFLKDIKKYQVKFSSAAGCKTMKGSVYSSNLLGCFIPSLRGHITLEVRQGANFIDTNDIFVQTLNAYFESVLDGILQPCDFILESVGAKTLEELDDLLTAGFARVKPEFKFDILLENRPSYISYTPLHFAAEYGLLQLCSSLMDCPGSRNALYIQNLKNMTPLQLSQLNGREEVSALLRQMAGVRDSGVGSWGGSSCASESPGDDGGNATDLLAIDAVDSDQSSDPDTVVEGDEDEGDSVRPL